MADSDSDLIRQLQATQGRPVDDPEDSPSPDSPVLEPRPLTTDLFPATEQSDVLPPDLAGIGRVGTAGGSFAQDDLVARLAFTGSGSPSGSGPISDSAPIPPDDDLIDEVTRKVMKSIELLGQRGVNIFATQDVMNNLEAMSYVPEVAWVLRMGPEFVEDVQVGVWSATLDALHSDAGKEGLTGSATDPNDLNRRMLVSMFWNDFGDQFTADERDLLTTMWASIPHGSDYLRQHAVRGEDPRVKLPFNPGIGGVNAENFLSGLRFIRDAPQDVRNIVQDPREKIVARSIEWLKNNKLETFDDKQRFFFNQFRWAKAEVDGLKEASGFWGRIGARLEAPSVGLFDVVSEGVALTASLGSGAAFGYAADPVEFAVRQHLSFGENMALALGSDPGSTRSLGLPLGKSISLWDLTSGGFDMALNLSPVDPINLAAGIGTGLSIGKQVARADDVGRASAVWKSLRPFSGRNFQPSVGGGLPVLSRGTIARVTWSLTSKQIDDLVESRRFRSFYKFVAESDSASEIAARLPEAWKRSDDLVEAFSRTNDPEFVKFLHKAAMRGGDVAGFDRPLLNLLQETWKVDARRGFETSLSQNLLNRKLGLRQVAQAGVEAIDTELDSVWKFGVGRVDELAQGVVAKSLQNRVVGVNPNVAETVVRNVGRIAKEPNLWDTAKLTDGRTVEIYKSGEETVAVAIGGDVIGGAIPGEVGIASEFTFKGSDGLTTVTGESIADLIGDALGRTGLERIIELTESTGSLSKQGLSFLRRQSRRVGGTQSVLRQSELVDDGATKILIAKDRVPHWKVLDVDNNPKFLAGMVNWLTGTVGNDTATSLAAKLQTSLGFPGSVLDSLNKAERALLERYTNMSGMTAIRHGDGMIVTRKGQKALIVGSDLADDAGLFEDVMLTPAANLGRATALARHSEMQSRRHLWAVADMPRFSVGNRVMNNVKTALRSPKSNAVLRTLRRTGAHLTMKLPGSISFEHAGAGAEELEKWVRFLGGSVDTARFWSKEFRNSNPELRNRVVQRALVAVGDETDNDLLRLNLINWAKKAEDSFFFFTRSADEMGTVKDADGVMRTRPLTMAHQTREYPMPNARLLMKTVSRLRGAKRFGRNSRIVRGILPKTKKNRIDIAKRYRRALRRRNPDAALGASDDDLMRLAYADVLGFENFGRGNGLGMTAQMARIAASPFRAFHGVFTVSQLALRAFPWFGRVHIEENVRAQFVGLPTLWRRPKEFMSAWFDAKAIRTLPEDLKKQSKAINGIVEEMFDPLRGADEILDDLGSLVSNLDELLAARKIDPDDLASVKQLVASELGRELKGGEAFGVGLLGDRANIGRRTLLRNRRLKRRIESLKERGFTPEWSFNQNAPDIANRSFFAGWVKEADAATMPLTYRVEQMGDLDLERYGRAYGRQVYQFINDPLVRQWGFGRRLALLEGGAESARWNVDTLIESPFFDNVLPNVQAHLSDLGLLADMTRRDIGQWYLDNVVDEIVETLFSPMFLDELGDFSPEKAQRVMGGLVRERNLSLDLGDEVFAFKHTGDNYEEAVNTLSEFTLAAYNRNLPLPPKIAGYFDPRFGEASDRRLYRRFTDYMLMKFGEEASQKLMRQPAFVHLFSGEVKRLKGYGWSDDVARFHASAKATEVVNWIFFNNGDTTSFLRKMNQVVPFFSAWWEVISTWAFKIPSQTFRPLGYTVMARRVDRFLGGLVESGLAELDENGQLSLIFSDEFGGQNSVGESLSGLGALMTKTPAVLTSWLVGLGRMAAEPFDGDGISFEGFNPPDISMATKDGFAVNIGNPLNPFGDNHGIMAVNNFQFGLTPALSFTATQALARAPFAADTKLRDFDRELPWTSEDGPSMSEELFTDRDISLNDFLNQNHDFLEEQWGREQLDRVKRGIVDPSTVTFPPGTYTVPQSSLFTQLVDETFFPFGRLQTPWEVITEVSPSTISYLIRGLGMYIGDDDTNMLTGMFGPEGQYQVDAEVLTQIQHLEATEGLASRIQEKSGELQRLMSEVTVAGEELPIGNIEEGLAILLEADHPRAEEFQRLAQDISRLNSQLVRRASDNAAWALIVRGLTGSFGPTTPRMFFREQEQASNYWLARDIAEEAEARGSSNFAKLLDEGKVRDFGDLNNALGIVGQWLEDPVGDQAKTWIKENHPGLLSFIQGRTFWGPGGPPPEVTNIDNFFEDVEEGKRRVLPPNVFVQRLQRTNLAVDRELKVKQVYGDDYLFQAQAQLNDWSKWRDVNEEFSFGFQGLDWIDQTLNEGEYTRFRENNAKDDPGTFYENLKLEFEKAIENVDDVLNAVDFLGLSPDEKRQVGGILNASTRGIRDAIEEFERESRGDSRFQNKRELLIADYFLRVADPFYTQRNALYDAINQVDDPLERSVLFDTIRELNNEQWLSSPVLSDPDTGRQVVVPNELMRAWNGKSDEEKLNQKLRWIGLRPEWLTLQATHTLALDNPQFAQYVPTTVADYALYDEFAKNKALVVERARRNPQAISEHERDQIIGELEERLRQRLVFSGRAAEVEYADAWPIQRLRLAGQLPPALDQTLLRVNFARQQLEAIDKGPTSKEGRVIFLRLQQWLERQEFITNPASEDAIDRLGEVMFDETLRAAVYPKLLYGDFFGTLD